MVRERYVEAETFEAVRSNQDKLIKVLNHNMTKMKVDISWLKKLQGWQITLLVAILGAIITIAIKL